MGENGKVYFVDAVHFLHNAVAGYGWIRRGLLAEIKTNSGRNRFHILGAYSPDGHDLVTIEGTAKCDAEMVQKLLIKLRQLNPDPIALLLILDNVPYHHTKEVKALARQLGIQLLYLPPYSPNLNLIERLWKFMKKKVARNKYYATFAEFITAATTFLQHLDQYDTELKTLMTENFHLFTSPASDKL